MNQLSRTGFKSAQQSRRLFPAIFEPAKFSTQAPELNLDLILQTPSTGLAYGRIGNITKNTKTTDIINLLDGSDLKPQNVKVEYNRNFTPLSMMVEFPTRSAYDAGLRAIGRKGRLHNLSRADRTEWDKIAPFDGKAILVKGLPRNALTDDVLRFLSGCDYISSSLRIFVRPTNDGPIRMALVRFPSQVSATHAYITKSGGFCLNTKVSLQVLH